MGGLTVLITNLTLATRTGTETYVRDLALALRARGHAPAVYSPETGAIADELRAAAVPVVRDLAALPHRPDIIHGHHHLETLTALLHFPAAPAVFVCHDRLSWHDAAPRLPRVLRYVGVDEACGERLLRDGAPAGRVSIVPNAVDLGRFRRRGPLPAAPRRALVFSNYAREATHVPAVREACRRRGLAVDVLGGAAGRPCDRPEAALGGYDLVFAKARCALEALAVGCAVVLCDAGGAGELVTRAELDRLRRVNFGARALTRPLGAEALAAEIDRYDPRDAAEVTSAIRATAGLDRAVEGWLGLYREVIAEAAGCPACPLAELRAAAAALARLNPSGQLRRAHRELTELHVLCHALDQQRQRLGAENRALSAAPGLRLQRRLARLPLVGRWLRGAWRWLRRAG